MLGYGDSVIPARYKGGIAAGNESSPLAWGRATAFHHGSGTDLRNLAYFYYLSDYRLARDMLQAQRALMKRVWRHAREPFGFRPFATLNSVACLYQETGDPEILAIGRAILKQYADLQNPLGVATDKLATGAGKPAVSEDGMAGTATSS